MESFYHLPPSSTTRDLPLSHPLLTRLDLQAITSEWLSLTMDPSSTPAHSLTATPIPPTPPPPPLPTDLAPFPKTWEPKTPSPAPAQTVFALLPQTVSRTAPFKDGRLSLCHTPVLPVTQPPPPPPDPPSSLISPLPDLSLRYNSGRGFTEKAQILHIAEPKLLSCTVIEPQKSSTQIPYRHKSALPVNKGSKTPDVNLHVKDPYDELLSIVLDGSTRRDVVESTRLSQRDSPSATLTNESKSRWFKSKAEKNNQPAENATAASPASKSAGSVWLDVQLRKPVTMEPLSIIWEGQKTLNDDEPVESQIPPSVQEKGYMELFIEEEDEALEDKEADVRVINERLRPQVEHGVSCIC